MPAVNRRTAVIAGLAAAAILALNLYAPAGPTVLQRFLASLLMASCSLPTLFWASGRHSHHSLMPYLGAIYALYFASPVFLRQSFYGRWLNEPDIDSAAINSALFMAVAGWALLMTGYFAPFHARLAQKLPRFNVLGAGNPRRAAAFAVVIGIAAAPFLYLDNAAVAAFYSGADSLLPSAAAFSVNLIGQLTILSALTLFYLQLRGELGLAGKVFLWGLVAYYVMFGLGTGLVLQGLEIVVALFVAYAITASAPTWRLALYGALTAAVVLLVLVPLRPKFRVLVWTQGVGAGDDRTWRISRHIIQVPSEAGSQTSESVVKRVDYEIVLRGRALRYFYEDAAACSAEPVEGSTLAFFVHVVPVDPQVLPADRTQHGYETLDFRLNEGGLEVDGRCTHEARLPDYRIDRVRTGLFMKAVSKDPLGRSADESLARSAILYVRTLLSFTAPDAALFERLQRSVESSVLRADMLMPIAWLTERIPANAPYLYGETYYPMLFKLIPRAVFPNKPRDVSDLGQRLGFLPEGNEVNAFKVHQLGELYVNFGALGVLLGMFAFGSLYRIIYQLFCYAGAPVVAMAAGAQILAKLLIDMESVTTVSWGFVLWYAVLLILMTAVAGKIRYGRDRPPPESAA